MFDLAIADLVRGPVGVDHFPDRVGVAVSDEVVTFVFAGKNPRVTIRWLVGSVRLHVVKVEKKRLFEGVQLALDLGR